MMKRVLCVVISLLLILSLFVGCGEDEISGEIEYFVAELATNDTVIVLGEEIDNKIYNYEYRYYLMNEISKYYSENFEKPDNYDDLSSEEQEKLWDDFFTDEVKKTVETNALEEVRKFKAEYLLSVEHGCMLTSKEKASVKSNIDYYVSMYVSYYNCSQTQAEYYITQGTMTLSEYKEFMVQIQAIEKYKNALKATYTVSDDEMKATALEDKAVADLEAMVEKAGSKYALKNTHKAALKRIMKQVLGDMYKVLL